MAATRGSSSRRATGQIGNTCPIAQLSMAERNTAQHQHDRVATDRRLKTHHAWVHMSVLLWSSFGLLAVHGDRVYGAPTSQCAVEQKQCRLPEKLMWYIADSGSPHGRSASGSTRPAPV